MFKLKKIINSGVNVPEPEMLHAQSTLALESGSTVYSNLGIITAGGQTTKPTHVIIKSKAKGEEMVLCHRISPNMIFEVEIVGNDVSDLLDGDKICLLNDGNGYSKCSTTTDGGVATIYDMNGATKSGDTVLVTFN